MENLWRKVGVFAVGFAQVVFHVWGTSNCFADATWTYAVQISATVSANPARIILSWPLDPFNPQSYTVFRKLVQDQTWGNEITLPGTTLSYTDTSVQPGVNYEYKVVKQGVSYTGYGYICAGIESPMIEDRGKLVLIVAAETNALSAELTRLESDLVGDGWEVLRHDVPTNSTPEAVKSLVVSDYLSDPSRVQAVFLFGRVPVFKSGNIEYDGHGSRPMAADAFYADMDGDWQTALPPSERPGYLPSDVELMVGRVDFSNMPGDGASTPWPSETELLRRYLNKDHAWRQRHVTVPRKALIANRAGDATGMAYAASGYRNFEPFVGPGNIVEANVEDLGPDSERWITLVSGQSWLWTFAAGAGQMTVISQMGTRGQWHEAWSIDMVEQDTKAVFSMLLGSHFGDWSGTDNLMRSVLAAPSVSLTACVVGLPHWFVHHMAKGEPIGYGTRLTMNNSTLYQTQSNALTRSIVVNLLGDPALRMEMVAPPLNLTAFSNNGMAVLNWTPSADPVLGYHVYRSASLAGPFSRLTASPVTATSFTDSSPLGPTSRVYMVRALARQTNPSGTYSNLSQGAFAQLNGTAGSSPIPQIKASVTMTSLGPEIRWNTQPGISYWVESLSALGTDWVRISGSTYATSSELTFTDLDWTHHPKRFYRVAGGP